MLTPRRNTSLSRRFRMLSQRILYPMPEPMPHTRTFRWATGLVLLAMLLFAGFFIIYLVRLQDTYMTHAEDLGIMDQAIWNTVHGRVLHQTICNILTDTNCYQQTGISRLAIHVEPILLPVSLLYLFVPTPKTLMVLQTLIVASGALPAFWLARLRLRNEWIGVVCALLYLLYPAQQQATVFDFHAVTLTSAFLMFALYFLYTRQTLWLLVFAVLSLACKEEIAGIIALMGLWSLLFQHRWRSGLGLIVLAFAWFGMSLVVLHMFSPTGHSLLTSRYAYLGSSPGQILRTLVFHAGTVLKGQLLEHNHIFYLRVLLTPTGYLALLTPWIMILALPTLLLNLLSTDPQMYSGLYQYSAELVPILVFATIEALWLLRWLVRKSFALISTWGVRPLTTQWGGNRFVSLGYMHVIRQTGVLFLIGAYLLVSVGRADINQGVTPLTKGFVWPQSTAHVALAQAFLRQVPPTASVSAQSSLVPHLSHRADIYLFPYADTTADYIFLDVTSDLYPFVNSLDYIHVVKTLLLDGTYGIVAAHDGYLLLKRGLTGPGVSSYSAVQAAEAPDIDDVLPALPRPFCSFVTSSSRSVPNPVQVSFSQHSQASSGMMTLIGFSVAAPKKISISAGYLSLTTYWKVSDTIEMPLQQVVLLTDAKGHNHLVSADVPSVYWCQTNTWKPEMVMRLSSRVFSLKTLALPRGSAHLSFALVPLLQPAKNLMDVQARLQVQLLHASKLVSTIPGTNALQVMSLTLTP